MEGRMSMFAFFLGRKRSLRDSLCGVLAHLALYLERGETWLLCIIIVLQVIVLAECEGGEL